MYINFFTSSRITIAKVRCIYILIIVENKIVVEEIVRYKYLYVCLKEEKLKNWL